MTTAKTGSSKEPYWLVYVALLIAGILLLADAYYIAHLSKWTARLGIGLIYSAVVLIVSRGRWAGNLALVIVWLAIVLTYIL